MYRPPEEMLPPVADQVTAVLVVPLTVAVNCCVPPAGKETNVGDKLNVTAGCATCVLVKPQPASDRITRERIPTQMLTRSQRALCSRHDIRLSLHDTVTLIFGEG